MSALARWCVRHRLLVVLIWIAATVGLAFGSRAAGTDYDNNLTLPGTESKQALDLLAGAAPDISGASDTMVWQVESGRVDDPQPRRRVAQALAEIAKVPEVGAVDTPYTPAGAGQISADGRTAYATITYTRQASHLDADNIETVVEIAESTRTDGLAVELGGPAVQTTLAPSAHLSELVGILAAAVVLFIAFGSVLSMTVPLISAVAALGAASLSMGLLSHLFSIANLAPTLGALIGLGVGIDYALFIITRHRNGLMAGRSVEESAVTAMDTAGRAVLFAGSTVIIAMLGMFVLGLSFLNGVAVAAALTVLFTMLTAVTLLPAMLAVVGRRALGRRERRDLERTGPRPEADLAGFWTRWSHLVQRRSRALTLVAVAVLAVLVIPFFAIRLGSSDAGNAPAGTTTRKAYDLLAAGFGPGFNGPLLLVAEVPTSEDERALSALAQGLSRTPGVAKVATSPRLPGSRVQTIQVTPTTSPQSEQTSQLIRNLRDEVVPTAERGTGLRVHVGGETAINDDFADLLAERLTWFVAVIVVLGCLLLLLAFRSVVVPLTAAVMNLVAAAAAFGVIVAIFQWGWGSEPLGLGEGPVEPFLPVLMLPVLFGLSMDYQVFLVSRMHEEWLRSGDNRRAVIVGQAATGRVITAAAAIMIAVFAAFAAGGERVISEFGVGLAAAVALDAFVLRTILVPAAMHLFGRSNWWLPRRLEALLPNLSVEGPHRKQPAPPTPLGTTAEPQPAHTDAQTVSHSP
ncbi:MMPL family transporter [Frankia sp. R43]|uniref:MMPL family transporter n=1 Tax=Frankia sp. R43 TaxID=269536 RepID=UPI0007C6E688|nr:MMPL family transporter [Frankia sp. R43]